MLDTGSWCWAKCSLSLVTSIRLHFFHVLSIQTSAVSHHTPCFLSLITVELFSLLASSTKLWNLIAWTYSTCFLCTCLKLFDVLFMCRIPEALILHEGLLRPCDDYCFFIMKTTTDSIPRWEIFKKNNNKKNKLDSGRFSTITFSVDCAIITIFISIISVSYCYRSGLFCYWAFEN